MTKLAKVTSVPGTFRSGGKKYGPFTASESKPFTEVPEGLAASLGLTLYQEGEPAQNPNPVISQTGTPLPDNFPAKAKLEAAGLTTLESVASKSDAELDALDGVASATVKAIRDELAKVQAG